MDSAAPTVGAVSPADAATGVPLTTNVTATFSDAMDPWSVDTQLGGHSVTLTEQGSSSPVAAKVSYSSTTREATLDPSSDLAPNTTYTATVKGGSTGAKDLAGNALEQDYSWTFTTTTPPPAPPTVSSYTPTQITGVARNTRPTATFSTNMDASTITPANVAFEVYNNKKKRWVGVVHTVNYNAASRTATVTPGSTLAASKRYRVTVSANAKSSAGVALDQDGTTPGNQPKTWTFTTGRR